MRKEYSYDGPIYVNRHEVWMNNFKGTTTAANSGQAMVFLLYRAKTYGLNKGYLLYKNSKLSLNTNLLKED